MPYTLTKGLVWVLLAVLLGIVIGWLLRSVAAKRQVERARSANLGHADHDELQRLRSRVANLEPIVNERDRLRAELDAERRGHDAPPPAEEATEPVVTTPVAVLDVDLDAASAVLGKKIGQDDLTVVEGIGPKIAELCHGIGIRTWADLAETEVSLLRTMLNDAGQRYKAHDPTTWPQQAALLAGGAWSDFRALTDRLDGGRPVE
jgi:predicted flap endonuclease-1-like 5' DNA nuclease